MEFPGFIQYNEFIQIADSFLDKYHPDRTLPIPIETIIEFQLNIHIVPVDGLMDRLGMDAYITRDQKEIIVDRKGFDYGGTRYRFSLAHEIAHVLLKHHELFSEIQTTEEWISSIRDLPSAIYGRLEHQANCVAGCILVPHDQLEERFNAAKARYSADNISDLETQDMAELVLANQYAVNDRTMHVRLEKERLLKYPWDEH